jgi:hypothetical protein
MMGCRRGREAQKAADTGRWTTELREHVTGCPTCREISLVVTALASAHVRRPAMPDPAVLWARARHARRLRAEAMVSRIITTGQIGAGVVALAVLLALAGQVETWPGLWSAVEYGALTFGVAGLAAAGILAMTRWLSEDI